MCSCDVILQNKNVIFPLPQDVKRLNRHSGYLCWGAPTHKLVSYDKLTSYVIIHMTLFLIGHMMSYDKLNYISLDLLFELNKL